MEKRLNEISFIGCGNVCVGDVLHFPIKSANHFDHGVKKFFLSLYCILKYALLKRYRFTVHGNGNTIFLFSDSYSNRVDHLKSFKKVSSIVENRIDVTAEKKEIAFSDLYTVGICFLWFLQMRTIVKKKSDRIYLIAELYHAFVDDRHIRRMIKKMKLDPLAMVSFCDVHSIDSFITQRMGQRNVRTVTLQHGAVMDTWGVRHFKSDFMLAISDFTIDAAKNAKADKIDKMIPVGLMAYSDHKKDIPKPKGFEIETIGVFLDDERMGMREVNEKMIKTVQQYAIKNKKKILYRPHPFTDVKSYGKLVGDNISGMDQDLGDFLKGIDLGIVHDSTVLLEGFYAWKPMVLFDFKSLLKQYVDQGVEILSFKDAGGLENVICQIQMGKLDHVMKKERKYFCTDGPAYESYRRAFLRVGVK